MHELAIRQHGLDAEHVVHGKAVLEAMRAARVLGDVASDRADDLARRIGCVVAAKRCHAPGNLQVRDTRLHRDPQVRDVNVEDVIEP